MTRLLYGLALSATALTGCLGYTRSAEQQPLRTQPAAEAQHCSGLILTGSVPGKESELCDRLRTLGAEYSDAIGTLGLPRSGNGLSGLLTDAYRGGLINGDDQLSSEEMRRMHSVTQYLLEEAKKKNVETQSMPRAYSLG